MTLYANFEGVMSRRSLLTLPLQGLPMEAPDSIVHHLPARLLEFFKFDSFASYHRMKSLLFSTMSNLVEALLQLKPSLTFDSLESLLSELDEDLLQSISPSNPSNPSPAPSPAVHSASQKRAAPPEFRDSPSKRFKSRDLVIRRYER